MCLCVREREDKRHLDALVLYAAGLVVCEQLSGLITSSEPDWSSDAPGGGGAEEAGLPPPPAEPFHDK